MVCQTQPALLVGFVDFDSFESTVVRLFVSHFRLPIWQSDYWQIQQSGWWCLRIQLSPCIISVPGHSVPTGMPFQHDIIFMLSHLYPDFIYNIVTTMVTNSAGVGPVTQIYIIKPTCCEDNPSESFLWMHLHQFQYLFHIRSDIILPKIVLTMLFSCVSACLSYGRHLGDMASQITSNSVVCSTVFANITEKIKATHHWPIVRRLHWYPVEFPHKGKPLYLMPLWMIFVYQNPQTRAFELIPYFPTSYNTSLQWRHNITYKTS